MRFFNLEEHGILQSGKNMRLFKWEHGMFVVVVVAGGGGGGWVCGGVGGGGWWGGRWWWCLFAWWCVSGCGCLCGCGRERVRADIQSYYKQDDKVVGGLPQKKKKRKRKRKKEEEEEKEGEGRKGKKRKISRKYDTWGIIYFFVHFVWDGHNVNVI